MAVERVGRRWQGQDSGDSYAEVRLPDQDGVPTPSLFRVTSPGILHSNE
jgi:hypothetical protein